MQLSKRRWKYQGQTHSAWLVNWRESGKRHRRQFSTKREAKLFVEKLIRERDAVVYHEPLPGITLRDFTKVYEQKKLWKTESYRERVLRALRASPFDGSLLSSIQRPGIEQFREERLRSAAPSTVRQELAALADCLKYAVRLGYLRKNPAADVERPSLPVKQDDPAAFIPREDFEKLLAVSGRDASLFRFAAWTGLRITELLNLETTDVQNGFALVRRGKGRKQRLVPLLPEAKKALALAPRSFEKPGKVFGWAADRHAVLRRFQRRCKKAGLPRYRFHDLRHSFASWAAMSGVSLEVIAQVLGHTSTTVTKKYAHLHPDYQRRELLKMAGARQAHALRKEAKSKGTSRG